MKISHRNGVFFASSYAFEEREALKRAGFLFHPGKHEPCGACRAGIGKTWWTRRPDLAILLVAHADDVAAPILRAHVAALASSRAMEADLDIPCPRGLRFYGYQRAGIAYMHARDATVLGDDRGIGKTIQLLGLINYDRSIRNVLVICPASLRLNWLKEARRWLVQDSGRSFVFHLLDEDDVLPSSASFVIASYNRVTIRMSRCAACAGAGGVACPKCDGSGEDVDPKFLCGACGGKKTAPCAPCEGRGRIPSGNLTVWQSLMRRSWDLIAMDESHRLKNDEAARTKCILGNLRKSKPGIVSRGRKKAFLTGTPMPNRPIELWPVLAAACPEKFGNRDWFEQRFCDSHIEYVGKRKVKNTKGASHLDELQELLRSTVMIRRLKKDVLADLPPKIRQIIELPVPPETARLVDEELALFRSKYEDKLDVVKEELALAEESHDDAAYRAAAAKLEYIQRVAFMEMSKVRHLVAVAKLPLCIEHIKDALEDGRKLGVFGHHKDVIAKIAEELGETAVVYVGDTVEAERDRAVERFQKDPTIRAFVGSIEAAGEGLTLTAASHAIFVEQTWTPSQILQAEDRFHRIGQTEPVTIEHLVWNGSLDAHMVHMIVSKQEIADAALDKQTGVEKKLFGDEIPVEPVTPYEKAILKQAIVHLAQKRGTGEGGGFSSFDMTIGQKLAGWHGPWSDRQAHLARKLARRYRGQIPERLLVELGLGTEEKKPTRKGPSAVEVLAK